MDGTPDSDRQGSAKGATEEERLDLLRKLEKSLGTDPEQSARGRGGRGARAWVRERAQGCVRRRVRKRVRGWAPERARA